MSSGIGVVSAHSSVCPGWGLWAAGSGVHGPQSEWGTSGAGGEGTPSWEDSGCLDGGDGFPATHVQTCWAVPAAKLSAPDNRGQPGGTPTMPLSHTEHGAGREGPAG